MLRHPCIQISYFAAGIIAHLSCLKDEIWLRNIQSSRESYVKLLVRLVVFFVIFLIVSVYKWDLLLKFRMFCFHLNTENKINVKS